MNSIRAIFIGLFLSAPMYAQSIPVSSSALSDSSGNLITNATIYFAPVLQNGTPASFRRGGTGGQVVTTPVSAPVTNGAFSITLADTNQTNPLNVCYSATVLDNVSGSNLLGPGYGCVQPTSASGSGWCSATACNFDNYPPNLKPQALVDLGPIGPKGDQGPTGSVGIMCPTGNCVVAIAGETAANAVSRLLSSNSGGGTVLFGIGTWQSGGLSITSPHVRLQGSGLPAYNAGYTALVGGTIIQGGFSASAGADYIDIRDLGVDVGSDWINAHNGGAATDGLAIANAGSVVGAPKVESPHIENVACLGYSPSAPFHCMLVENVNNAVVRNVRIVNNFHGLIIKATNFIVDGVFASGHIGDSVIIKSDDYANASQGTLTNVYIKPLGAASLHDTRGIIMIAQAAPMADIRVSNVHVDSPSDFGIQVQGPAANLSVTRLHFSNISVDYPGGAHSNQPCLVFLQNVSIVSIDNLICTNMSDGVRAFLPVSGSFNDFSVTNSHFANISANAIETYGRWAVSNSSFVVINGSAIQNDFGVTSQSSNLFASTGANLTGPGTFINGPAAVDNAGNSTFPVSVASPLFFGSSLTAVSALSTPTVLPNSGAASGMLRLRDNTLGGAALFLIDANTGPQLIGTSSITGITSASAVTFAGGNWRVSLSSGASPRTISWTIYE